jgi:hypothetical protein
LNKIALSVLVASKLQHREVLTTSVKKIGLPFLKDFHYILDPIGVFTALSRLHEKPTETI